MVKDINKGVPMGKTIPEKSAMQPDKRQRIIFQ